MLFDEQPRQGEHLLTIEDMMNEAREVEHEMHAIVQAFVEKVGGLYKQGPLKLEERVRTKTEVDYEGDHLLVSDIVRDTCVFEDMKEFANAIDMLIRGDCGFEVIRGKDRLNEGGNSYGYRDFQINFKIPHKPHIAELQLHLKVRFN